MFFSTGKPIRTFTYGDLSSATIRYIHNGTVLTGKNSQITDDIVDIRISDGKNDVSVPLVIEIVRNDNVMPTLESTYAMRVKELSRKAFTKSELNVIDADTPAGNLKFIVTHQPQFGTIERIDKHMEAIQTLKNSHKFELNKNQTISLILAPTPVYAVSVTEFTMDDIDKGLISYYHKKANSANLDRFGFVVFDGVNNMFMVNGVPTTSVQLFTILIDAEKNRPPVIKKNMGIEYLYNMDNTNRPGRMITKNEWSIVDPDDVDRNLTITLKVQPMHGFLEHKDRPGVALAKFTQEDISQMRIFYVSKVQDDAIVDDYFLYDVHDSANNSINNTRFDIRWSIANFEFGEVTVMEDEGKVRVHITKTGNLKQYSIITCKTVSDTAKSNRDTKSYDFIHTVIKLEFNEGESYKACDIVINKDSEIEPIESFYVLLEDPKYSIIGKMNKVKINILDKQKCKAIRLLFSVPLASLRLFVLSLHVSGPWLLKSCVNPGVTSICQAQNEPNGLT